MTNTNGNSEEKEVLQCGDNYVTKKYGPFLVNMYCYEMSCNRSEKLIQVNENCCHCGTFVKHTHCKNCGGIFYPVDDKPGGDNEEV